MTVPYDPWTEDPDVDDTEFDVDRRDALGLDDDDVADRVRLRDGEDEDWAPPSAREVDNGHYDYDE